MNIVLLGAPGAGKGTQALRMEERYKLKHISTGDIFRQHMRRQTEVGNLARSYIKKGQLVPDDVTLKIVSIALEEAGNKDFLLDGFPRNTNQAEMLDGLVRIDKAIDIDVDHAVLTDRICGRRMCSCGATYHVSTLGGATTCAKCGKPLYRRDDDNPETVEARLNTYAAQTAPLVDYYAAQGKLCTVNGGAGSPEQVFAAIAAELDKYVK